MMTAMRLENRLSDLLRAIVILSPHEFQFAGSTVTVPQAAQSGNPGMTAPQTAPMVAMLQSYLYQYGYNRPFTAKLDQPGPDVQGMRDITGALIEANAGRERWDAGWQVQHVDPSGIIYAGKQSKAHMFWPGEYVLLDGQSSPRPGAVANVFLSKGTLQFQPGFYVAFSNVVPAQFDQINFVRVYWNVSAAGAPKLMKEVTARLNRYDVPFRLKCLSYAELYERFDSGVLFLVRRDFPFFTRVLPEILKEVGGSLGAETPLFTKRLAAGVAFAEDPGTGDSYGFHRCGLVAQGIWSAYLRGLQTETARWQDVQATFAAAGLDAARPWLGPGSVDQYDYNARD